MQSVKTDFDLRRQQISNYFVFLAKSDPGAILGEQSDKDHTEPDVWKMLKANAILLIYNSMESTVANAIEAIFTELKMNSVSFDECSECLRLVILKNARGTEARRLNDSLARISVDLVTATFDRAAVVSGNVDAKQIRKLAKQYGFDAPKARSDELLSVKESRNDLAHGRKTFAEVGRDFDFGRLCTIRDEVLNYLDLFISNVRSFVERKSYLNATVTQ